MKTTFKFWPMLAIVAGIAFSAFTAGKPAAVKNNAFANYYWFPVNASGQTTQTTPLNTSAQLSKADAMDQITDCEDFSSECLRGSTSSTLPLNTVIPVSGSEDNRIKRN